MYCGTGNFILFVSRSLLQWFMTFERHESIIKIAISDEVFSSTEKKKEMHCESYCVKSETNQILNIVCYYLKMGTVLFIMAGILQGSSL